MSTYTDASLIVTPNTKKAGKLYALKGADLDVVRATTATYIGSDGLNKTALANEVRFDYTNGSCPSILVEPQRTNLLLRSEEFNVAPWVPQRSTISTNTTISPTGNLTADTFNLSNVGQNIYSLSQTGITSSSLTNTFSIYVKYTNRRYIQLTWFSVFSTTDFANFDLITGTITGGTYLDAKINNSYDGFFRISITSTGLSTNTTPYIWPIDTFNAPRASTSNGIGSYILFGAQLEAGSNATSYIPTTTSSVTRNADVISKSGISSLIGQTEGTFYSEIQFFEGGARFNGIELFGNSVNRIYISKDTNDLITVGFQANSIFTTVGSFNSSYNKIKIAIRYKSGNSVVYVNGVNVGSSSVNINFTTSINTLNCNVANNNIYILQGRLFSCAVFPLGLTNSELQKLTTL